MIRLKYILLFLVLGNIFSVVLAEDSFPSDSVSSRILQFDQEEYIHLKSQKRFDYYTKFEAEESGWLKDFQIEFYRWLRDNLTPDLTEKQFDNLFWVGLFLLLLILIVLLYIYKPSIFYLDRKKKLDYQLEDEDLDGLNVDRLIQQALDQEDYAEAIRWRYMKILRALNEKDLISFDPNKTVNEYVYEITRSDLRADFKELSLLFAYYRYGNGEASFSIFERFTNQSNNFQKRIL